MAANKSKPKKMSLSDFNKAVGGSPGEDIPLPTAPRSKEEGQENNPWTGARRGGGRESSFDRRESRFDPSFGNEQRAPREFGGEQRAPREYGNEQRAPREFGGEQRAPREYGNEQRAPREYDNRPREGGERDTRPSDDRFDRRQSDRGGRDRDAPRSYRENRFDDPPKNWRDREDPSNSEEFPPLVEKKERPKLNLTKKGEEPENLQKPEPKIEKPKKK